MFITTLAPRWGTSLVFYSFAAASDNNRTNLCTGLSITEGGRVRLPHLSSAPSAIKICTFLTSPSLLGYVWITLARGHLFREQSSSLEITISPVSRLRLGRIHLCLDCKVWRNSWRHLNHNSLVKKLDSPPAFSGVNIRHLELTGWG